MSALWTRKTQYHQISEESLQKVYVVIRLSVKKRGALITVRGRHYAENEVFDLFSKSKFQCQPSTSETWRSRGITPRTLSHAIGAKHRVQNESLFEDLATTHLQNKSMLSFRRAHIQHLFHYVFLRVPFWKHCVLLKEPWSKQRRTWQCTWVQGLRFVVEA